MNWIARIRQLGTVRRNHEAVALLQQPGDCVVVERVCVRSLVFLCPDGCDTGLTVNLDPRSGAAWRLYRRHGTLTLFPSVWRTDGCRSHFILWKDHIFWCSDGEEHASEIASPHITTSLELRILSILSRDSFISYVALAEHLQEIPWDVLWACNHLVCTGKVLQRPGEPAWFFKKL